MDLIRFENVDFTYKSEDENDVTVLRDFNLNVEQGSFVALLGHNGSGKSTVAKLTNGILFPEKGCVYVDGQQVTDDDSVFDIRKKVGMVFQNPDNQIVASIVVEDVAFGAENLGLPPDEIRTRVDDALKRVGMYEHKDKAPHKLSGGQKQRLCIARAMIKKPKILILDDSTSAVDTATEAKIRNSFYTELSDTTVFIIAQRISSVKDADKILVVDDGEIKGIGTHDELIETNDIYKEIYETQQKGVLE